MRAHVGLLWAWLNRQGHGIPRLYLMCFGVIELAGGVYDGDDVSVTMYEPLVRFLNGTDGDVGELNVLEACLVQARSGLQTLAEISNLLPK